LTIVHALIPGFTNRADHLNSIESRIKRMEALLQSSGFVINSASVEAHSSRSESIEGQSAPTPGGELSNLMISDGGEQKYIGMIHVRRTRGATGMV